MTLAELVKLLVETEDQMERMALVEANNELLAETSGEVDTTKMTEIQTQLDNSMSMYTELKQKYIDTFFSGKSPEDDTPPEDTKDEIKPSLSIDDVLKGGN